MLPPRGEPQALRGPIAFRTLGNLVPAHYCFLESNKRVLERRKTKLVARFDQKQCVMDLRMKDMIALQVYRTTDMNDSFNPRRVVRHVAQPFVSFCLGIGLSHALRLSGDGCEKTTGSIVYCIAQQSIFILFSLGHPRVRDNPLASGMW